MKILGVGLSRTGTSSLYDALMILGYNSMHLDDERLNNVFYGIDNNPNFRVYDDIDAITDLPSAYFFRELLEAYPNAKAILTVRDTESWWKSIYKHFNVTYKVLKQPLWSKFLGLFSMQTSKQKIMMEKNKFRKNLRRLVYGSTNAREFLYKKKYEEHNLFVKKTIPADRLLILDFTKGDGWEKICKFYY